MATVRDQARTLALSFSDGLGKHGWVSVPQDPSIPTEMLLDRVEESYRTVAPVTLVVLPDARAP